MAMYIAIRKQSENDLNVIYSFGVSEDKVGRIQIDKTTGNIDLLDSAPNDESASLFSRASRKLQQHWERGEYPDATCWAS